MRFIESDENLSLRGSALKEAIKDDLKLGLIPFWVRFSFNYCIFNGNSTNFNGKMQENRQK